MPFERPIFAFIALSYCICLGVFAVLKNRNLRANRYFAYFNWTLAWWNLSDYSYFMPNHAAALWFTRFCGIGGCWMIPFLMEFSYELMGLANKPVQKRHIKFMRGLGALVSILYLTPWITKDVSYGPYQTSMNLEIPGPLYPLFGLVTILGLILTMKSGISIFRERSHPQRTAAIYIMTACVTGTVAMGFYFYALTYIDMPIIYYTLECLVAFLFSYAMFKHNLIPVSVAFRRAALLVGIYVGIMLMLIPIILMYQKGLTAAPAFKSLISLVLMTGILFSLGTIIYALMIHRSAIFQDKMTSHLTHEFKSPLHAIQGAKAILDEELAKEKPNPLKIQEYMQMIQRNSERLEGFVRDILDLTKAAGNSSTPGFQFIDLPALIKDIAASLPNISSRISLSVQPHTPVKASPEGLRQIVTNLLVNAGRYSPEGSIDVSIRQVHDGVETSIRDKGPGISKTDLTRIFEPFVVLSTTGIKNGTGLGLSIAQKWVETHHGRIWAESDGPGRGSTFYFVLPTA